MSEEVLGGRFELEAQVALGGMGSIHRGLDLDTKQPVAVKLLRYHEVKDVARFEREAEALAELSHPGIVRYVAHGTTSDGRPYLVMEWLEGETLWTRMHKRPLAAPESVVVAIRVAEALGAAHAKGIVHRDVKPENLLLIGGRVDFVKVIDFGIARRVEERRAALTGAGATVGTPGYMAPEQARGLRKIDARADVFAMGCVLYECLTGRPTFYGENQMAVSLKILIEDPPRLRELTTIPEPLDDLVARMLAKDPDRRPPDGRAVAEELEISAAGVLATSDAWRPSIAPPVRDLPATRISIESAASPRSSDEITGVRWVGPEDAPTTERDVAPRPTVISTGVSAREQRVFSVVLADAASAEGGEAVRFEAFEVPLKLALDPFGGSLEILEGGAAVVTISGVGAATDQAARAARCAIAMRELIPGARIVVATGRGVASGAMPVGEVIDRGVRALWGVRPGSVRVDDLTADLLGTRFEIGSDPGGRVLAGEVDLFDAARTLLGRVSPFVGRDGEIATLDLLFGECVAERRVRTVLVLGPAGSGKSRLRYEFLRRLRERGDAVEVFFAQGDPMSTGSPFAMLAPAIRRAAGILEGEAFEERRRKLRARLGRHLGGDALRHATTFLGEMVRAPVADGDPDDTPQLHAARADARTMAQEMRVAWETWIEAETGGAPLLFLLDDMQWGDRPSLDFIDGLMRRIGEQRPMMFVALARPEVLEQFPGYFPGRRTTEIRLDALSPEASEALVQAALGADADERVVARIVERSDGNPFYLEEMTRSVALGGAALPESVLGVLQARLDALSEPTRRVLRAASVFGSTFWWGGVAALLGGGEGASALAEHVAELCAREVVYPRGTDVFAGETDYVFASDLVREAAYAALPEEDRAAAHLLAAEWLERAGEDDPVVLAEHFDRGGARDRAMDWYRRGAERALDANDFALALARAERAIACGATGETQAGLWLVMARAHGWRGENKDARRCAEEAIRCVPRTATWYHAIGVHSVVCGRIGDSEGLRDDGARLLSAWDRTTPTVDQVSATAVVATWLLLAGVADMGTALLDRIERDGLAVAEAHPRVLADVASAFARRARFDCDLVGFLRSLERAVEALEGSGDRRTACIERVNIGFAYAEMGLYEQAEEHLRGVLDAVLAMGTEFTAVMTRHVLGFVLLRRGEVEESRRLQRECIAALAANAANARVEGRARVYLSMADEAAGDVALAEAEAARAAALLVGFPPGRAYALGRLASARLAGGKAAPALDAAREAMGILAAAGGVLDGDTAIRLAFADALAANGEAEAAKEVLADARTRILATAARISNPAWRESYLAVAEHARLLAS